MDNRPSLQHRASEHEILRQGGNNLFGDLWNHEFFLQTEALQQSIEQKGMGFQGGGKRVHMFCEPWEEHVRTDLQGSVYQWVMTKGWKFDDVDWCMNFKFENKIIAIISNTKIWIKWNKISQKDQMSNWIKVNL